MIGLSSITVDATGDVLLDILPESILYDSTRRVSRTKTLDGGCVIVDGGFSDSDRTLDIVAIYSDSTYAIVKHLHEDKTLIYISTDTNFYSGVISSKIIKQDITKTIKIQILIKEKLN